MPDIDLRKLTQASLIASLLVSAALGIFSLLFSSWGGLQIKILLTSITVSCASITSLACSYHIERQLQVITGKTGVVFSLIGAALVSGLIWGEVLEKGMWQTSFTFVTLAVAQAHICLLYIARLSPGYGWAQRWGRVFIYTLALLALSLLWDFAGPRDRMTLEVLWRIIGVNIIVVTVLTVLTPVFHKLSGIPLAAQKALPAAQEKKTFCPKCNAVQSYRLENLAASISCTACGVKFSIRVLE